MPLIFFCHMCHMLRTCITKNHIHFNFLTSHESCDLKSCYTIFVISLYRIYFQAQIRNFKAAALSIFYYNRWHVINLSLIYSIMKQIFQVNIESWESDLFPTEFIFKQKADSLRPFQILIATGVMVLTYL